MPSYLLDTDVIIDVLNDKRDAAAMLRGLILDGHSLGCCALNITEVFAGARPAEERPVAQFLGSLDYHAITPGIARRAGLLKRDWEKQGVTLASTDVLIAAVALEYGLILVTRNTRHFPVPQLRLHPPD